MESEDHSLAVKSPGWQSPLHGWPWARLQAAWESEAKLGLNTPVGFPKVPEDETNQCLTNGAICVK